MPADRDWVFPRRGLMAWCNYPQPSGRGNLQEFVRILANATPRLLCWMWCDDSIPVGHEQSFQEFCSVFRRLPLGKCETVKKEGGCVVRRQADAKTMPAIYAVNTAGRPACVEIAGPSGAKYRDVLHNVVVTFSPQGKTTVKLDAYQMNVLSTEPN